MVLTTNGVVGVKVATRVVALYETVPAFATLPIVVLKLNVVPLIVAGFMSSLNVTVTTLPTGTLMALFAGDVAMTVGAVVSAIVVNVEVKLVRSVLPATSVTPVVTVSVKPVPLASGEVGVNVAVLVPAL